MTKLLVVDDSETVRIQLRKDLSACGFEVVEAADGLAGLEQARSHQPALIICDLNMPKLDGLGMVQQLRKETALSAIPVFMLTTEAGADVKAKAKELGIRAWITKPYDPSKLNFGIRKVLGLEQA